MSMATTPYEVQDLMTKIDKPTAIFMGSDDEQFIPEKVLDYAKLINGPVQLELVEQVGHLSILLEVPKLIANCLK